MTSVSSRGPTPHSPYDAQSAADTDESWQYLDNASYPASVGFLPSPASGSLNGYAVVGHHASSDPAGLSPLNLDLDPDQPAFSAASFPDQAETFVAPAPAADGQFVAGGQESDFLTPQGYLFSEEQVNLNDLTSFVNSFQTNVPLTGLETFPHHQQDDINLSQAYPSDANPGPWSPTNLKADNGSSMFFMEDLSSLPQGSASGSSPRSNPTSPDIKYEGDKATTSSPIRKVITGKVEKKKVAEPANKFVIVTPHSINAHSGRPNPFECFEALKTQTRGRKGPLANATKESALQVRRLGACFCCHSRKVKCDSQRPCKNCKKLAVQVPQVVCWQFSDFLTVLFPDFMRSHFRKDQMSRFMTENVDLDAVELAPREIELFSGLSASLKVKARFFRPRTADVQQHYHLHVQRDRVDLQARGTAPMVLELDSAAQREALRKKVKEYLAAIAAEPKYAKSVTESIRHTDLPRRVLDVVQKYASKSDSAMVKKALAIYGAHFVMTRHLCITRPSVVSLQDSGLVPQEVPWVTPRVLNRQIKAVIDELLMRDMQHLFDSFSKSLKPKSRREWAPCMASFLVLCLFMESVETAADTFVVALNEISLRNHTPPEYQRQDALNINREVENMPFKQFAYQFHQIYQTHSRDMSTKPFNPMLDSSWAEQGDLDGPATEMVMGLKELIQGDSCRPPRDPNGRIIVTDAVFADIELDFLTMDPILPSSGEQHPFPRDVSVNYTGRLVAKFLLSFLDEKYIFGENTL
ncbi:uncharacterized protein ColSpa_12241 [Colletotrichum spaethianum]|uniref:Zn(2)-C6 fungal-type domain-containing protein n=1 Tax=Colletotrichum spaethianum TaxID=700344 RepID=A0AA37PHE2_9PEZI|nr:uncharacterized protein ColSpa_12241 [Colletotrichum spaethianum]GKT52060.1 hypothetical protein ColSpa_12241 [Colletotrichum spaethianum]